MVAAFSLQNFLGMETVVALSKPVELGVARGSVAEPDLVQDVVFLVEMVDTEPCPGCLMSSSRHHLFSHLRPEGEFD